MILVAVEIIATAPFEKNIRRSYTIYKNVTKYSCHTDTVKILDKYLWRNFIWVKFTAYTYEACNSAENWNLLQVFLNAFDNACYLWEKCLSSSFWIKNLQNIIIMVFLIILWICNYLRFIFLKNVLFYSEWTSYTDD